MGGCIDSTILVEHYDSNFNTIATYFSFNEVSLKSEVKFAVIIFLNNIDSFEKKKKKKKCPT